MKQKGRRLRSILCSASFAVDDQEWPPRVLWPCAAEKCFYNFAYDALLRSASYVFSQEGAILLYDTTKKDCCTGVQQSFLMRFQQKLLIIQQRLHQWIEKKEGAESATPINQALVEGYYKQILAISENLNIPLPADWFQTLLRMPDVMTKTEIQELTEEEWKAVHAAVAEAIGHLVDFRKQEGAALEKKFREKIANITSLLEKITPYEKERVEKVKERITDALEKTLSVDYDKNRLEQELIYYIEKLDVNEEKQRLSNHLKYFISTLESGNGQGKKLGFIAQEMGREINTLGSKSNHAEMQKIVVQMKDELEQIKEQVLNVM